MTLLAPTLQLFFTERMVNQRQASPATITSYRNTFRLLLRFMQDRTGKAPSDLDWADLDVGAISAFLDHLETARHNSARSRNTRLAALRSLFRFAALRHPEHAELIQHVLAIPQKRFDKTIVSFLEPAEIDALLAAPDLRRWEGRRDRALLVLAVQTGLRLSELIGLNCGDVGLGPGAHVRCRGGKGRKQRCVPLTPGTTAILGVWLKERGGLRDEPAFPTRTGRRLSDDAVEARLAIHETIAQQRCSSLAGKKLTPHTLRHTCAMTLLRSGVDVAVIALWLGHADSRSTTAYLHADMTIKERALARTTPPTTKPGRYRPPDDLLAFLEGL
jgi:site-specific recombinase XerD